MWALIHFDDAPDLPFFPPWLLQLFKACCCAVETWLDWRTVCKRTRNMVLMAYFSNTQTHTACCNPSWRKIAEYWFTLWVSGFQAVRTTDRLSLRQISSSVDSTKKEFFVQTFEQSTIRVPMCCNSMCSYRCNHGTSSVFSCLLSSCMKTTDLHACCLRV